MTTAALSLEHLLKPSSLKEGKIPVLFMFHGYGSNEEDLFSFASDLPPEFCIISVRAPLTLPTFGYAWYTINFDAAFGKWSDEDEARWAREKIVHFIEEACTAYYLDKNNVTLLGFSQGTILSYAVALSYPEKIRNVIALSGYINESILVEDYAQKDHSKVQIYASHGSVDQVIPVEWAQNAPALLEALKIPFTYEEFPVGHGVSPQNFVAFKKWLKNRI
ncbi:alpha/beta fold hydrolase [Arenibacter sp. GZD96]|uniref:alpha/beta hydrolase n=1 Tax=Aurantibrevibacter litoralis TaxID=3106030 RepID=UPI002AFED5F3|nr:alpha/beta fold hydrolase [Arenibacter sp. GZD-96]MEA1787480.1 alpha/beta fold hydrolase [Arenibacter sp. GZD-96]